MPDDELDEKEDKINKAHRKLERKISSLGDDIDSELRNIIRKGKNTLEDDVDSACNRMRSIVNNEWKRFTNFESKIQPSLDNQLNTLVTRTLKKSVNDIAASAKKSIDKCISEFFNDSEDVFMKYLPEFDSRDFVNKLKKQIELEVSENDLFTITSEENNEKSLLDYILKGTLFVFEFVGSLINYNDFKADVLKNINSISSDFDPTPYLEAVLEHKDEVINTVREKFITELIEPLQNQIAEIKASKADKASRIEKAEAHLDSLQKALATTEQQMSEIEALKVSLT